jgi:hypothetical protein
MVLDAKVGEIFIGHFVCLVVLVVFDLPWKGADDLVLVADESSIR